MKRYGFLIVSCIARYGFLIVSCIALFFVITSVWFVAHLPQMALSDPRFKIKKEDADLLQKVILPELGQYGDMFGGLGVLIAGLGFVGLFYSMHQQKAEQRSANYITTVAALLDHYTSLYTLNTDENDKKYNVAPSDTLETQKDKTARGYTIKGKMDFYVDVLETIRTRIRDDGDFDFEKEKRRNKKEVGRNNSEAE